jgi:hypothetical protein
MDVIMDSDSVRGIDRRRLLGWGGLAGAGVVAAGVSLAADQPGHADTATSEPDRIPPDTRPGGAYDRYIAKLAAEDKFEGQWELSRGGVHPGSVTYWSIYPDTGWVGVVLSNYDDIPLLEILEQQTQAITGASPGGGGG